MFTIVCLILQMQPLLLLGFLFGRTSSLTIPISDTNQVSSEKSTNFKPNTPLLYHRLAADQSALASSNEQKGRSEVFNVAGRDHNDKEIFETRTPKNYAFSYAIKDRHSGDDFSHTEAHTGKATNGEYRVKLPDDRIQVVTYIADNNGYRANIRYEKGDFFNGNNNNNNNNDNSINHHPVRLLSSETGNSPSSVLKNVLDGIPKSIRNPVLTNLNAIRVNLSPPTAVDDKLVKQTEPDKSSSSYESNAIRSAGFNSDRIISSSVKPPSTDGSYEITESYADSNNEVPYSPRLVSDVNYLLRYVKPAVESGSTESSYLKPAAATSTSSNTFRSSKSNPKYIHIHRYHPTKGEIVTSNLVTSKEIFDKDYGHRTLFDSTDFDKNVFNFSEPSYNNNANLFQRPSSNSFHNHHHQSNYFAKPSSDFSSSFRQPLPIITESDKLANYYNVPTIRNLSSSSSIYQSTSAADSSDEIINYGTFGGNRYSNNNNNEDNNVREHPTQQTEYSSIRSSIPYYGETNPTAASAGGNSYESSGGDNHDDDDNSLIPLSDIEARKLSGYFDFVPEEEIDDSSAERIQSNHLIFPQSSSSAEDSSANHRGSDGNSVEGQRYGLSPEMQYVEGEKQGVGLPHYFYELSTASPTYRYVEPQFNSQAPQKPSTTVLPILTTEYPSALFNNTIFRTSPFLRPLTRERVYIHHNSQPNSPSFDADLISTYPSIDPFNELTTASNSATREGGGGVEVTIVKSLSSTIPPELIDEFDQQLPSFSNLSPISVSNASSNNTVNRNYFEDKSNVADNTDGLYKRRSPSADFRRIHQQSEESNLKPSLVQKLQSTLSTRATVKSSPYVVANRTVSGSSS